MDQLIELARTLGSFPPATLALLLGFAAFGLAAFAIFAVMSTSRRERSK